MLKIIKINQNEFDALVSFTYNLGCGKLAIVADLLNTDSAAAATAKMEQYVYAGQEKLPGLVRRRQEEVALFRS